MDDLAAKNFNEPVLDVKHAELERVDRTARWKSVCPVCKEGCLLVHRMLDSLKLSEKDHCILCGQQFRYTDIEEMRANDWPALRDFFKQSGGMFGG